MLHVTVCSHELCGFFGYLKHFLLQLILICASCVSMKPQWFSHVFSVESDNKCGLKTLNQDLYEALSH